MGKNSISDSRIGLSVSQEADGETAGNQVSGSEIGGAVAQRLRRQSELTFGKHRAKGALAILALLLILALIYVLQYASQK